MERNRRTGPRKSPLLLLLCLAIWLALAIKYGPALRPLFVENNSFWPRLAIGLSVAWIHLMWFYATFHLMSFLFSLISRHRASRADTAVEGPAVAILYTICNDFCTEAAESCLRQEYAEYHLFLLDDSSLPEERNKVDRFQALHSDRSSIVRRPDREGFKAGNLNHALRGPAGQFTYFAVVDADEVIPPDFLGRCVAEMEADSAIGFVQVNHRHRRGQSTHFARDLGEGAELHWGYFLPARNRNGFVIFYGHGAVIRRQSWCEIGGFPEIVSEDIAFSTRVCEVGYRGVFLSDVVAEEAFPESYGRLLRRELKVARGTLQFLLGPGRSFLLSRRVTWVEKVDMLLSVGIIYLPAAFLGFLLCANVAAPLLIARKWALPFSSQAPGLSEMLRVLEPLGAGLQGLWTWDFYLLTLASILSPLIYQLPAFLRSPRRLLRYAFQSTAVYLAVIPPLVVELLVQLGRKKVDFVATADRSRSADRESIVRGAAAFGLGVVLSGAAIAIDNLALLAISLSFLLHALFWRISWERRWLRVIAFVPFFLFVTVFGSLPLVGLGVAGAMASVLPAHH